MRLEDIVTEYIELYRGRAANELRWFAIQRTIDESVRLAAFALNPTGKRLSHQRRIPKPALRESHRRLLASLLSIQQARTFEQLHKLIRSRIMPIAGIGELTVYDTALRVGAKLRLEPNVVFLHAGTRTGAERLGLDGSRDVLTIRELPVPLRRLRPREIEDVLCIYKNDFGQKRCSTSRFAQCNLQSLPRTATKLNRCPKSP